MLVLCLSAEALAADWPQLESHTFRLKDPLNHNRRFIPLRLDGTPTKGSLAQFSYIDWRPDQRAQEYAKLLEACLSGDVRDAAYANQIRDVNDLLVAEINVEAKKPGFEALHSPRMDALRWQPNPDHCDFGTYVPLGRFERSKMKIVRYDVLR